MFPQVVVSVLLWQSPRERLDQVGDLKWIVRLEWFELALGVYAPADLVAAVLVLRHYLNYLYATLLEAQTQSRQRD
jgi:hypothetical protein